MVALRFILFFLLSSISLCSSQGEDGEEEFTTCRLDGGEKGDKGERGPAGPPGQCNCELLNKEDIGQGDAADRPVRTTCSNIKSEQKPQWMGKNEFESFKINCDETENLTCIVQDNIIVNKKPTPIKAVSSNELQTLWWSEIAEQSLMEMYKLRPSQVTWLHGVSNSAQQTLRIFGLDIKAQNPESIDSVVKLLMWNDVVISHKSTPTSLFHYTVELPELCIQQNSTTKPCEYVDLTVKTDKAFRIPITDIAFHLDQSQTGFKIAVQNVKMCFK